jgi:NarL family two-component system response regulator LiaR
MGDRIVPCSILPLGSYTEKSSGCVPGNRKVPDVVLLDLLMPKVDGITVVREIKRFAPTTQIVILTSYYEDDQIFNAIKAGALAYLLKESSTLELLEAIRAAARGESKLHPRVAALLLREMRRQGQSPLKDLTPREL